MFGHTTECCIRSRVEMATNWWISKAFNVLVKTTNKNDFIFTHKKVIGFIVFTLKITIFSIVDLYIDYTLYFIINQYELNNFHRTENQ